MQAPGHTTPKGGKRTSQGAPGSSGNTPAAKRPADRASLGAAAAPGGPPLDHESLTQAFYTLNASFHHEQAVVTDLRQVVSSHAQDLEVFAQKSRDTTDFLVGLKQTPDACQTSMQLLAAKASSETTESMRVLRIELNTFVESLTDRLLQVKTAVDQGTTTATANEHVARMTAMQAMIEAQQTQYASVVADVRAAGAAAHAAGVAAQAAGATAENALRSASASTSADPMQRAGGDPWNGQSRHDGSSPTTGTAPPVNIHRAQAEAQARASTADGGSGLFGSGAEHHHIGSPPPVQRVYSQRPGEVWRMYEEKKLTDDKIMYDKKKPLEWMQDLKDYLAGRTPEMDRVLDWAEKCTSDIDANSLATAQLFMDQSPGGPCAAEISRQLWALMAPLVKSDEDVKRIFKNAPLHNGLEAWRRVTEPVLEGCELTRKSLQPIVLKPKGARKLEDLATAIEVWAQNERLFREAQGSAPSDAQKRLILIDMLPPDVAPYITLQLDVHTSYLCLKKFVLNYAKVMKSCKASRSGGIHLVDKDKGDEEVEDEKEGEEEEDAVQEGDLLEVLAFMKSKGIKVGGKFGNKFTNARPRPAPISRPATARREPPPRGIEDVQCINCGIKGHRAQDCRKTQNSRELRPCFECGKTGHVARYCPSKKSRAAPVKKIEQSEDTRASNARGYVMAITVPDADGFQRVGRPAQSERRLLEFLPQAPTQKPTKTANSWANLSEDILSGLADRIGSVLPRKPKEVSAMEFPALSGDDGARPICSSTKTRWMNTHNIDIKTYKKVLGCNKTCCAGGVVGEGKEGKETTGRIGMVSKGEVARAKEGIGSFQHDGSSPIAGTASGGAVQEMIAREDREVFSREEGLPGLVMTGKWEALQEAVEESEEWELIEAETIVQAKNKRSSCNMCVATVSSTASSVATTAAAPNGCNICVTKVSSTAT